MGFDLNEHLPGTTLPLRRVRDWLRREGFYTSHQSIASAFPDQSPDKIMQALVDFGIVEREESSSGREDFKIKPKASLLVASHAWKPITRQVAERTLRTVIKNAEEINKNESGFHLMAVHRLRVFGSYLDKTRETFGDVDILIEIVFREQSPSFKAHLKKIEKWIEEKKIYCAPMLLEEMAKPSAQLVKHLRKGQRYAQLCSPYSVGGVDAVENQIVFDSGLGEMGGRGWAN